jgi:hypothetical protein
MATSGCNFCGKVGMQPISNDLTTFNYDCLEVKNKKSNKNENQKKNAKNQSSKGNQVCTVYNQSPKSQTYFELFFVQYTYMRVTKNNTYFP